MAEFIARYVQTYDGAFGDKEAGRAGSFTLDNEQSADTFTAGDVIQGASLFAEFIGTTQIEGVTYVVLRLADTDIELYGNPADGSTVPFPDRFSDLTLDNTDTDNPFTVCFAAGTLIATPDGERKVETLRIADPILTHDGRTVAVKWIGRQTLHRLFTPADRYRPVRIAAGALGGGVPHTDLVLTKDHGLLLDGVMANAGALMNGTTITEVPMHALGERETYYHIETEAHAVILANGTPAETFIDNLARRAFDNDAEFQALYGDPPATTELAYPRAMSLRQLPASLRARIGARATA